MKLFKNSTALIAAVAAAIMTFASSSFASSDYYLKIDGIKGEAARIIRCPDGSCSVDDLKGGDYEISFVDANGKPITPNVKLDVVLTAREAGSGMATGRTASVTTDNSAVTAPRDAASGLATGRRQYQPIRITKEIDKGHPTVKMSSPSKEDVYVWKLSFTYQKIEMK